MPFHSDRVSIESPTGATLSLLRTLPASAPRGIVLLFHGLAEHSGRYARVASELAHFGFAVFAHDHRGHGSTAAPDAPLRRFARRNGAAKVVADAHAVFLEARHTCGILPTVVFGHSMGGLIALNFAIRYGSEIAGLAVWNTATTYGLQQRLGVLALKVEKALKGSDVASRIMMGATIDAWSRSIEPRRTPHDWLSHDEASVAAFASDPLCGWAPTVSMAEDIVALVRIGGNDRELAKIPSDLPVHLLGGTEDPATSGGKATENMARQLRFSGCRYVTVKIIEGARHEALQEAEPFRAQAMASLTAWLEKIVGP